MKQRHKRTRVRLQRIMNEALLAGESTNQAIATAMRAENIPRKYRPWLLERAERLGRFK